MTAVEMQKHRDDRLNDNKKRRAQQLVVNEKIVKEEILTKDPMYEENQRLEQERQQNFKKASTIMHDDLENQKKAMLDKIAARRASRIVIPKLH